MTSNQELASQFGTFSPLTHSQLSSLRQLFLSFTDTSHLQSQHPDNSATKGVLGLFRSSDSDANNNADGSSPITMKLNQQGVASDDTELLLANPSHLQQQQQSNNPSHPHQRTSTPPAITWKSFHRVCAAIGLHLSDKRGEQAIKKLSSPPPSSTTSANTDVAGMTFDDFLLFYSTLSKSLTSSQELHEIWRLLDDDMDGYVTISLLRQVMVGLEWAVPPLTNNAGGDDHSLSFEDLRRKYNYTSAEKSMSKEEMVDDLLKQHFIEKNIQEDKINFQEFVEFLYS